MNLELNDEQAELLIRELSQLIDNDRYFLGSRARVLKEILGKLRPEPERPAPPPPLRNYEPPKMGDIGDGSSHYIPLQPCWLDQTGTRTSASLAPELAPDGLAQVGIGSDRGAHR